MPEAVLTTAIEFGDGLHRLYFLRGEVRSRRNDKDGANNDWDVVLRLEPADEWPEGYVASFAGVPDDFERPVQRKLERREKLD